MLRTRLWMGAILIALVAGVLVVDQWLARWYPFLFVLVLGLALLACYELLHLLGEEARPAPWLCYLAVAALVVANWLPRVVSAEALDPWYGITSVFVAAALAAFLVEMAAFQAPPHPPHSPAGGEGRVRGQAVARISLTVWVVAYLGLLPSFLAQLRWLPPLAGQVATRRATAALALAIFVPKCGDVGAYFTGRFLGRHPMAPVLSPKKTWEGAAGGLAAAVLAAVILDRFGPVVAGGLASAAVLGLVLGIAGMLGDLAESLIKRDCRQKDASQVVPGFGGILDVVDSVLFAAPVAYWWLA